MRALIVLALLSPATASAQPCASTAAEGTTPSDGAMNVPRDVVFRAFYPPAAIDLMTAPTIDGVASTWDYDAAERTLSLRPDRPLDARTTFVVTFPAFRDASGVVSGNDQLVTVTTGDVLDAEFPFVAGASALTWDAAKTFDECLDGTSERYHFELTLDGVEDDGPREALSVLVFRAEGPGLEEGDPPELVHVGALGEGPVSIALPRERALGRVCLAPLLRDSAGHTSPVGASRCVTTERPPFFEGCSASGAHRGSWLWLALLALVTRRVVARRAAA